MLSGNAADTVKTGKHSTLQSKASQQLVKQVSMYVTSGNAGRYCQDREAQHAAETERERARARERDLYWMTRAQKEMGIPTLPPC
jgi:hypothetical protein